MQADKMKVKKIKVATLTGPLLDYWVARADKLAPYREEGHKRYWLVDRPNNPANIIGPAPKGIPPDLRYSPSTNWSQGGQIIERDGICLDSMSDWREDGEYGKVWEAHELSYGYICGDTPLIAAMRCYVASKFGEEVDEI